MKSTERKCLSMDKPSRIRVEYNYLATGDLKLRLLQMEFDDGPHQKVERQHIFQRPNGFKRIQKQIRKMFQISLNDYYLEEYQVMYKDHYIAYYRRKNG